MADVAAAFSAAVSLRPVADDPAEPLDASAGCARPQATVARGDDAQAAPPPTTATTATSSKQHEAMVARLAALEAARREQRERRQAQAAAAADPRESADAFLAPFLRDAAALRDEAAAGAAAAAEGDRNHHHHPQLLLQRVAELERSLASAAYFLPPYDQRRAAAAAAEARRAAEGAATAAVAAERRRRREDEEGEQEEAGADGERQQQQPPVQAVASGAAAPAPPGKPAGRFSFSARAGISRVRGSGDQAPAAAAAAAAEPAPSAGAAANKDDDDDDSDAALFGPGYDPRISEQDLALIRSGGGLMGLRGGRWAADSADGAAESNNAPPGRRPVVEVSLDRLSGRGFVLADLRGVDVRLVCCAPSEADGHDDPPPLPLTALRLHGLVDCRVVAGPVAGSALVLGARRCELALAARQVRVHDARECALRLRVASRPVVERCGALAVAPLLRGGAEFERAAEAAGLPPAPPTEAGGGDDGGSSSNGGSSSSGLWRCVNDFGWVRATPSPNWRAVGPGQEDGGGGGGGGKEAAAAAAAAAGCLERRRRDA